MRKQKYWEKSNKIIKFHAGFTNCSGVNCTDNWHWPFLWIVLLLCAGLSAGHSEALRLHLQINLEEKGEKTKLIEGQSRCTGFWEWKHSNSAAAWSKAGFIALKVVLNIRLDGEFYSSKRSPRFTNFTAPCLRRSTKTNKRSLCRLSIKFSANNSKHVTWSEKIVKMLEAFALCQLQNAKR